jgi:hypothetical protein
VPFEKEMTANGKLTINKIEEPEKTLPTYVEVT